MILKTNGIFFDGITSSPQYIEVSFDKENDQLYFSTAQNQSTTWNINEAVIEHNNKSISILFGHDPIQLVKLEDQEFLKTFNDYLRAKGKITWYHKLTSLGTKINIAIALFLLSGIVLCYLYLLPWVAEKTVVLIPENYDTELGNTVLNQYLSLQDQDSSKTEKLNLFAKELNLKNTKPLNFIVLKSDIVNAFALPNGSIVVYTGILEKMEDYNELVGLIGHEVSHVNNRHSMKMMCRNLSGYLFISAVLSDVNGIMAIIGDNANNLQSLSFSRKFEKEADYKGFDLMILNKVNPDGMKKLFTRLQSSENTTLIPEFLSSHPVTTERLNYIEELLKSKKYSFAENNNLLKLFEELKK